ncbi:V-type ATP synthase subunit D [Candidatus Peregrinibacteria bacterium]|nr:MAG: V-type ATP synthase subunit D [Candidatus Peregrinibacteria bacterium]
MAVLRINPTRVNLLSLRKRVKTAQRGHKLLKDKRDGLMKQFMNLIRETKQLREEVEIEIGEVFLLFLKAGSVMSPEAIETALLASTASIDLLVETKNVMSVRIPQFEAKTEGKAIGFTSVGTSSALEMALKKLQDIFPRLLRLAELEKATEALAQEIEKTRRRVNTLEYRMIPDLKDTVRFITMKIEESARDTLVSVMRIKAMIQAKEEGR